MSETISLNGPFVLTSTICTYSVLFLPFLSFHSQPFAEGEGRALPAVMPEVLRAHSTYNHFR